MKMKKIVSLSFTLLIITFIAVLKININVQANYNIDTPYYTYTADSNGFLVKTMDAYTPGFQIKQLDSRYKLERPEHVFVDKQDYIYIADSDNAAVFVLNDKLELVTRIIDRKNLKTPTNTYVTDEKIYVVEFRESKILVYDKHELLNNNNVQLLQVIEKPLNPIFHEGKTPYPFKPAHITVDLRGNIYIQGEGSTNGLIMLDEDGNFMTFFGGNPVRMPLLDRIRTLFLTEKQEEGLQRTENKVFVNAPSNIAMDSKGFVYTVTSSVKENAIKKFNVSGQNFFKQDIIASSGMVGLWIGQYNNVYSTNGYGYIFEYDTSGNLLFVFGGKDFTSSRFGLLNNPVSIASNSKDKLFVVDQGQNIVQIYEPTYFANTIHEALSEYQKGNYEASREKWEYILEYNALFDYAHIGLGDAYMRDDKFNEAYREYKYAQDYQGISDAYWGIRQEWMKSNLTYVFLTIVLLTIARITYLILNRSYDYSSKIQQFINKYRKKNQVIDELLYIFTFLRHPFNGFYDIKTNRVSVKTSTVIYFLLAVLFISNYKYTNLLFVPKVGVNIAYELFVAALIVLLWIVSNYLVCAINDGEGSFKNVYNATAYALAPILVIMPFIIIISNFITYQEHVFYDFGYTIMTVWTAFLMFFMIKDIHNYEVKQTIGIILKSIFTMLIIGLMLFVINTLSSQMLTIIEEIITEVRNR